MVSTEPVVLVDEPDQARSRAAARLWRAAEEARVPAPPYETYLDDQERGFLETLGRAQAWLTVATLAGAVVGCAGGLPAPAGDDAGPPTMSLAFLVVADAHRRAGIGRRLVRRAEHRARSAGSARMVLTVFEGNDPARALYEALGWECTGRTERTPLGDEMLVEYVRRL